MQYISNDDNMVVLWNKMAGVDSITDRSWESMLDYHYEKFRYFYHSLKEVNMQKILMVMVEESVDELQIVLEFKNEKQLYRFLELFQEATVSCRYPWKHHFDIHCNEEGARLNIAIKNRTVAEECEIYHETILDTSR